MMPNKRSNTSEASNAEVVTDLDSAKYPISPYDIGVALIFLIQGIVVAIIGVSRYRNRQR
jgi:hypothetical protein